MKDGNCARGTSAITLAGSLGSRSNPGTFVRRTRVSAFIATAIWAATRSASALISSPRGVTPGGEITGTYPASKRSWIKLAFLLHGPGMVVLHEQHAAVVHG